MSYRLAAKPARARKRPPDRDPWDCVERAQESVPVNLSDLAEALRLRVLRAKLEDPVTGVLNQEMDGSYTIFVSQRLKVARQRFTIAHEMGHYLLHYDRLGYGTLDIKAGGRSPESPLFNARLGDQDERLADQFAFTLLMPAATVRRLYRQGRSKRGSGSLAKDFHVTRLAMRQRLGHLKRVGYL